MRVLLDERVHAGVRKASTSHSVTTVPEAGWSGIKNGELLARIAGNFDVFLTIDQNLPHQQKLTGLPFAVLIVTVPNNTIESYLPLFDMIARTVNASRPGDILTLP